MSTDVSGRTLRIIVVDDEPDAADGLAALARLWGHDIQCVYDAASAFALAIAQPPDVILSDLAMPELDGLDLARMLRRQELPQPVLVAVTGYGDDQHRRDAIAAGFDHFFAKPAAPDDLR